MWLPDHTNGVVVIGAGRSVGSTMDLGWRMEVFDSSKVDIWNNTRAALAIE
jgi:hypothetical protein